MEETEENLKQKVNLEKELLGINSMTIYEYEKTVENFNIDKIKIYSTKDKEKTVTFLFYDNEFFAVDRVNFEDNYEYDKKNEYLTISENLNYKIKKIPNVAKTRKILNIEDIETRIYDVSEYIVLLNKENFRILKVENDSDIQNMEYKEYEFNVDEMKNCFIQYNESEEEKLKEEKSLKNKFKKFAVKVRYVIVEPLKLIKTKLYKTNEVKMLTDGKHSIFDK